MPLFAARLARRWQGKEGGQLRRASRPEKAGPFLRGFAFIQPSKSPASGVTYPQIFPELIARFAVLAGAVGGLLNW